MPITRLRWPLVIFLQALIALAAHAETSQDAQLKLLQLEKQSHADANKLLELNKSLSELAAKRSQAQQELAEKEASLNTLSTEMQAAVTTHFAEPSPDHEREANKLSRSFSVAEMSVSRQRLEAERAEQNYTEAVNKIAAIKADQTPIQQTILMQKARIAELKSQELKNQALAAAEKAKSATPAPVVAPTPPTQAKTEPAKAETKTEAKPIEKQKELSIEEQQRNINRVINGNSPFSNSGF